MKVIKAAAVQLSPVLYSREGTVDKVVRKIHELGQQGVQFGTKALGTPRMAAHGFPS
jgi:nitrilase